MFSLDADTIRQLTEGLATIMQMETAAPESEQSSEPKLDEAIELAKSMHKLLPDFEKDPGDFVRAPTPEEFQAWDRAGRGEVGRASVNFLVQSDNAMTHEELRKVADEMSGVLPAIAANLIPASDQSFFPNLAWALAKNWNPGKSESFIAGFARRMLGLGFGEITTRDEINGLEADRGWSAADRDKRLQLPSKLKGRY